MKYKAREKESVLLFDLAELVDLFRQLIDSILLLLLEGLDLCLGLEGVFLHVSPQLLKLGLALLVNLHL